MVGGGNSGLEAAIEMAGIASEVHLISRSALSGEVILQDKVAAAGVHIHENQLPERIHGDGEVQGIDIRERRSGALTHLPVDGVFVKVGLSPNSDYALDLLDSNGRGEIRVDRELDTGVRGIFAAGDVTDGRDKQVVIAAGESARAALAAASFRCPPVHVLDVLFEIMLVNRWRFDQVPGMVRICPTRIRSPRSLLALRRSRTLRRYCSAMVERVSPRAITWRRGLCWAIQVPAGG